MAADKPPSAMSAAALPQLKKVESFWVLMAAVRGERWSRAADPGCLLEQKQSQRPVSDGYCLLRKAKQYDSLLGVVLAKAEQSFDPPRHRLCLLSLAPTCSEGYPGVEGRPALFLDAVGARATYGPSRDRPARRTPPPQLPRRCCATIA